MAIHGYSDLEPHIKQLRHLASQSDVAGLIRALKNPTQFGDDSVRARAARYLGDLRAECAVDSLCELLLDKSPSARAAAAGALGEIGSSDGTRGLIEALNDDVRWVRARVIASLGEIGDRSAVTNLLPLRHHEDWTWVRAPALYALLLLDDREAQSLAAQEIQRLSWVKRRALLSDVKKRRRRRARDGELGGTVG